MALGGERTEKRTLHTPLTEMMDGHRLQTQASACWEELQTTQRASLSSADPRLEEAEGALPLKPLSYDRRAEARVTGLSSVVSDHVNSNKPHPR